MVRGLPSDEQITYYRGQCGHLFRAPFVVIRLRYLGNMAGIISCPILGDTQQDNFHGPRYETVLTRCEAIIENNVVILMIGTFQSAEIDRSRAHGFVHCFRSAQSRRTQFLGSTAEIGKLFHHTASDPS